MATPTKNDVTSAAQSVKDDVVSGAENIAAEAKDAGRKLRDQARDVEASLQRGAEDLAATVTGTLRAAGVDTDKMVEVAKEQATDLQKLVEQEIRERPLRALGLAAAVGLFVGFIAAR
jgi:ElaB/YqjD/DUF883 family membrane-anchored ribosome-binding protein